MNIIKLEIKKQLYNLWAKPMDFCDVSNASIVSFDVFDTLIVRKGLKKPSDLFERINDSSFKQLRCEAEKNARKDNGSKEVTIEDIYKYLPQYDYLIEEECEYSVCTANQEMIDFFDACRKIGKRLIIISDMYYGRDVIAHILENAGYSIEDVSIFVSSEYKTTKKSGKLFRDVIADIGVYPNDVLHIGDELISDYLMAKKAGIQSFLYRTN